MKITRKGFMALAKAISDITNVDERHSFTQRLLPALYDSNPHFDAVKFCKAAKCEGLL